MDLTSDLRVPKAEMECLYLFKGTVWKPCSKELNSSLDSTADWLYSGSEHLLC